MHPKKGDTDLARRRSLRRFERTTAAAPTRKRQLGMSIARSLPKYQFCVMFSVLTTSALLFGYTCSPTSTPTISCRDYNPTTAVHALMHTLRKTGPQPGPFALTSDE